MRIFVNVGDDVWISDGKVRCVKVRKNTKNVCLHCALEGSDECYEYECQYDHRKDHTDVYFKKVEDEL